MKYTPGAVIDDTGKTKVVRVTVEDQRVALFQYRDNITRNDDATQTRQFAKKAELSNKTNGLVFELFKQAGLPVAYQMQVSLTEFAATKCQMIPLEVVARRYAVGSYLKRHPEAAVPDGAPPHRFHQLEVEFFLKTKGGNVWKTRTDLINLGLKPDEGQEDPHIENPADEIWSLHHSKKPRWSEGSLLTQVLRSQVLDADPVALLQQMNQLVRQAFLALEGLWHQLGCHFVDLKIEFGIDQVGRLLIADVIDPDSWRLRTGDWQEELSKQLFRDDAPLTLVADKYQTVVALLERFRMPKQCIVCWRASSNDGWTVSELMDRAIQRQLEQTRGLHFEDVALSGHKSPQRCLEKVREIVSRYPDGGVVLVNVGKSNGLGPMLATRWHWPVITFASTARREPNDIWSSLNLPSNVPMATIVDECNAFKFALMILGQKNPLVYMDQQYLRELLDT